MTRPPPSVDRRIGIRDELLLQRTAVVFLAAVLVHGADHLRRGLGVVTMLVVAVGTTQLVVGAFVVGLVFARHRMAPAAAAVTGFTSAIGFTLAHLLPEWSALSDPFVGPGVAPGVTWFSWFTALFEIGADVAFGWAGVRAQRSMRSRTVAASVGPVSAGP